MPLLWLSLAAISGILLGSQVRWTWQGWLALGAGLLAAVFLLGRLPLPARVRGSAGWLRRALPPLAAAPVALAVAVCLGAARYQLSQPVPGPDALARFNGGGPALITGQIAAPPEPRDGSTRLRVAAVAVQTAAGRFSVRGQLLANVAPDPGWRYGDRIELAGSPQTPPEDGDFSYREYLARQDIYTFLPFARATRLETGRGNPFLTALYLFRERALNVVDRLFPPPESALLAGILLGEDSQIPAALQQAFRDTGTSHIIAISGFNIGILSALFVQVFSRLLGRRWGSAAALAAIAGYTLLVGAGASVVRAAIMGSLALVGSQLGRRQIGTNLLAITAGGMGLIRPAWLWDVGFQLSFGATLGLILYAQPLQEGFARLANRLLPFPIPERVAGWTGAVRPVHAGRPDLYPPDPARPFPAHLAGCPAGQHPGPATPAAGDDPGRAGDPGRDGLAPGRPGDRGHRLAVCRLHRPGGRMAGRRLPGRDRHRGAQPAGGPAADRGGAAARLGPPAPANPCGSC